MSYRAALILSIAFVVFVGSCTQPPKRVGSKPFETKARPAEIKAAAANTAAPDNVPLVEPDQSPVGCAAYEKAIADAYAAYIDAYYNYGKQLSPDGQKLLFLSNRAGGSMQLYVSDARRPGSEPIVIAKAKDRVGAAWFSPDGKHAFFTRDHDANENWQIFRATADGKQVTAITTDKQKFHHLPWIRPDGSLVYMRGIHAKSEYELVVAASGSSPRSVFNGTGFHWISDMSRDGQRVLLTQLLSMSQSRLMVVDLESGKEITLAPLTEKKSHAHSAVFSSDGKSVFVISDEGTERAGLRKIDAATGKVLGSFDDDRAEVSAVEAAPKGNAVAVVLDAGSHATVALLDGHTMKRKARLRGIGLGSASLGRFSADGRHVVVTMSSPSQPAEVFAVNARTGQARPLRRDTRPGLEKLARVVARVERIKSFDGLEVPVNVYLERRRTKAVVKRLPVIVDVHGGPAHSSHVEWSAFTAFLIARGFAVVQPNVRGSTGFGKAYEKADNGRKRLDSVKDLQAVNEWLREQPWAEPEKLVVFGGSYGGYMTYMALGHQPRLWRAGVGLVGVVNLRTFLKNTSGAIRLAFRDEFGRLDTEGDFLDSVSPIKVVERMSAPLFVYQGATDPRVPRGEQDQLVAALRATKRPVEYMVAPDEGHSCGHRHNKLAFMSRTMRFLDQHLGRQALPESCALRK